MSNCIVSKEGASVIGSYALLRGGDKRVDILQHNEDITVLTFGNVSQASITIVYVKVRRNHAVGAGLTSPVAEITLPNEERKTFIRSWNVCYLFMRYHLRGRYPTTRVACGSSMAISSQVTFSYKTGTLGLLFDLWICVSLHLLALAQWLRYVLLYTSPRSMVHLQL